MFKKILVANRGEIACRVMKTAQKMGIQTVAVYSDSDVYAKHVELADEAVSIGGTTAADSYLVIDKILDACRETGAEAVHPGYGFLSENALFAEQLDKQGIAFIGPGTRAIEAMGDKITSKKLADEAGVNTIPGHTEVIQDVDEAVSVSSRIGYPVMIKASAGGGGKGMRVAFNETECRDGFERATSEAISSFGDGRIFIEKYIQEPRHIEIQVIADTHGNVITLNERECSIQRRHQKVIEEAPSPFIDPVTREKMSEQAVLLSKAVDYQSAGTVELIVDKDRNFYFLEMNTRLQVEHPVTEYITGLDLVELMIRVAAGEVLPIQQKDVQINGWSIEARVYAESAFRNFLPSTGRLVRYIEPEQNDHVRVDSGVLEGSEISMFYDPMISKLVTWGKTRDEAIQSLQSALDAYYIRGVETNIPFVSTLLSHKRFVSGALTTNFIADEYPDGFSVSDTSVDQFELIVVLVVWIHQKISERSASITGQVPGYGRSVCHDWCFVCDGEIYSTTISQEGEHSIVTYDKQAYRIIAEWNPGSPVCRAIINDQPICMQIERDGYRYTVSQNGTTKEARVLTPNGAEFYQLMPIKLPPDLSKFLLSPMPGLLVSLNVEVGQQIKSGDELAVIEAMKMENSMRAEQDSIVAKVLVSTGEILEVDQPILEFE